jgi:hypothetical protein
VKESDISGTKVVFFARDVVKGLKNLFDSGVLIANVQSGRLDQKW